MYGDCWAFQFIKEENEQKMKKFISIGKSGRYSCPCFRFILGLILTKVLISLHDVWCRIFLLENQFCAMVFEG